MSTNPQAAGKTKFTFQLSEEELSAIKNLAAACRPPITPSAYVRFLCQEAIEANARVAAEPAPGSEHQRAIAHAAHQAAAFSLKGKGTKKAKGSSAPK